ncbi:hypothetical protein BC826DRAFT_1109569 [Russula brevipes]|nr:hypothetical protein BC826DRAFT_1109569 [Russula brevipes]
MITTVEQHREDTFINAPYKTKGPKCLKCISVARCVAVTSARVHSHVHVLLPGPGHARAPVQGKPLTTIMAGQSFLRTPRPFRLDQAPSTAHPADLAPPAQ